MEKKKKTLRNGKLPHEINPEFKLFNSSVDWMVRVVLDTIIIFWTEFYFCDVKNWKSCQINFWLRREKKMDTLTLVRMQRKNENNGFHKLIYIPLIWTESFFFGLARGKNVLRAHNSGLTEVPSSHRSACRRDCGDRELISCICPASRFSDQNVVWNCTEIIFSSNWIFHMLNDDAIQVFFCFDSWGCVHGTK